MIASHSAFGKSLLPRVAAILDVQQISDIMSIQTEDSESLASPRRPHFTSQSPDHLDQHLSDRFTLATLSSPFSRLIPSRS